MRSAARPARCPQPSGASASSITRVSSESSRSCTVGRAAGQRGQQQHAVGNALGTRQANACRQRAAPGCRGIWSRTWSVGERVARCRLRLPARPARASRPRLMASSSACESPVAIRGSTSSASRKGSRLRQDLSRFASRMSRQTAGSLAAMREKSRKPTGSSEKVASPSGRDPADEGEGEQERQVADGGKGGVVRLRRHLATRRRRRSRVGGALHQSAGVGLRAASAPPCGP